MWAELLEEMVSVFARKIRAFADAATVPTGSRVDGGCAWASVIDVTVSGRIVSCRVIFDMPVPDDRSALPPGQAGAFGAADNIVHAVCLCSAGRL